MKTNQITQNAVDQELRWVKKKKAEKLFGLKDGEIRSKMRRIWEKGYHWATIDGRVWINVGRVQAWLEGQAQTQRTGPSESGSNMRANDTRSTSTKGPLRRTSRLRNESERT